MIKRNWNENDIGTNIVVVERIITKMIIQKDNEIMVSQITR